MIPIHDTQGRIVGFGSRTLTNEEPKYLNSPETEVFNKGKILFGLDKARSTIAKQDQAIVVEGYFDVIALHAAGISNAVASMGTALSQAQIRQLLRYTESKQILFNFDADKAGAKAADRAIGEIADLVYRGEVQLRVITIPNGKDADDFLKEAEPAAYQELVKTAPLWIDWQIQQMMSGVDLRQSDQFQQVSAQIVELLGKLPNASMRTHYVHRCAGMLSQGDSRQALQLEEALRFQVKGQRWHGQSQRWQRPADFTLREAAEAQLLRIYLHCATHRPEVHQALASRELEFSLSHHRYLWRQILRLEDPFQVAANAGEGEWVHPELLPAPGESDLDLISAIKDLEPEDKTEQQHLQRIYPLLQLDETTSLEILRPVLSIRAAAASLERIACEKRCRHLLELFEKTLSSALDEEEAKQALGMYLQNLQAALDVEAEHAQSLVDEENYYLQELHRLKGLYYQEKRYLEQLDTQRCISLEDLRQGPVVEYVNTAGDYSEMN
jgi:DNA primase